MSWLPTMSQVAQRPNRNIAKSVWLGLYVPVQFLFERTVHGIVIPVIVLILGIAALVVTSLVVAVKLAALGFLGHLDTVCVKSGAPARTARDEGM
jgi:hypothetical protein